MIDPAALLIFVTAALLLLLTPGPAVMFIVARSLEHGRTAGVVSAFGVAVASICHVVLAVMGLSALLMQSALAFSLVKYIGALYLIYLGIQAWRADSEGELRRRPARAALPRIFWQGFIVNLFNPKTALFFFAFLPQFVQPQRGAVTLQILLLGSLFVVLAIISDSAYAVLAGSVRHLVAGQTKVTRAWRRLASLVYIGLGLTTAVSGSSSK